MAPVTDDAESLEPITMFPPAAAVPLPEIIDKDPPFC